MSLHHRAASLGVHVERSANACAAREQGEDSGEGTYEYDGARREAAAAEEAGFEVGGGGCELRVRR